MGKTTLVIMAAGMGSRFGGIKQITPVGPSGEIILDYSVYDAVEAGFDKVILIIRRDIEKDFKEAVGNRLERYIDVEYAFQDMDDLPPGFVKPAERVKPWGTGHAVLSIRDRIDTPFAVINADDYYGKEAFVKMHDFLCGPKKADTRYCFCMAAFQLGNTLSENGSVTRGICKVEDGVLTDIVETYDITKKTDIPFEQPVSMNMWGFTPDVIEILETRFITFLKELAPEDYKSEFLLPTIVGRLIKEGLATVYALPSKDKWFGVTYQEDVDTVKKEFLSLTEQGVYKRKLFD